MERLAWILLFLFFHLHVPARAEDDVDRAAQRAFVDWPTSNMTHVLHDPPQYMLDIYEKYKIVRNGVLHDVRAYFDKGIRLLWPRALKKKTELFLRS